MNKHDAVDLDFTEKDKQDIRYCLCCKCSAMDCRGDGKCPQPENEPPVVKKRKTRAEEINEMADQGVPIHDILQRLGLKPTSVRSLLSRYSDQFSPSLHKQIIFELGKEKENGKQNERVEQVEPPQADRGK